MNATIKASNEVVVRLENEVTIHITKRHVTAFAPGGHRVRHFEGEPGLVHVLMVFKAALEWKPRTTGLSPAHAAPYGAVAVSSPTLPPTDATTN